MAFSVATGGPQAPQADPLSPSNIIHRPIVSDFLLRSLLSECDLTSNAPLSREDLRPHFLHEAATPPKADSGGERIVLGEEGEGKYHMLLTANNAR
eukprot:1593951-Pyramimonas_sp.AAC.2